MAEATIQHAELNEYVQKALQIIYDDLEMENVRPIGDRVLCKPIQKEYTSKTDTGLFVVQDDDKRPRLHFVVAVADAVDYIEPGDIAIAGAYIGHPVDWGGESYRLIAAKDVLGIVNE